MFLTPETAPVLFVSMAVAGVAGFVFSLMRRGTRKIILEEVRHQFKDAQVLALNSNARFLGFNRPWDRQWRGHGILLLSRRTIYFRLIRRNLDLTIPLARIEAVDGEYFDPVRRKLHRKCFRLSYRGVDGETREAAWKLSGSRDWMRRTLEALERMGHGEADEAQHLP